MAPRALPHGLLLVLPALAAPLGCSSVEDALPADGGTALDGASGTTGGATDGGPSVDGGIASSCEGGEPGPPPTETGALQAWLATRAYTCWAHEGAVHASAGPHGGNVKTFANAVVLRSLVGNEESHRPGSALVKELYGQGTGEVTGWAVSVKVDADSQSGQGWYWYEVFGTAPDASAPFQGLGHPTCTGCHAAGHDYVLTPLR